MGMLDKLFFWKKKDEPDFDSFAEKELQLSDQPVQDDLGLQENSPFDAPTSEAPYPPTEFLEQTGGTNPSPLGGQNRDLELISSKLDTVKALLTSLDQRIANLEKVAGVEQKPKLW